MCAQCGNRMRFETHGARCDRAKKTRSRKFGSCGLGYSEVIWNDQEYCDNCLYDLPEMVPQIPYNPSNPFA